MISWEHWQTLLAVYRCGTYAAAATSLGINATTVGRRIKLLEHRLGCSLLLRSDGKLVPTSSCAPLFSHLESVAESLRTAENETAPGNTSEFWREVTVTCAPFLVTNLLAPALGQFVGSQRVRIDLLGTGNNISLSRREADIAIKIEDGGFTAQTLSELIIAEPLMPLHFAVYKAANIRSEKLPWAGLIEDGYASTGMSKMISLAGSAGFQFRARHFDTLHMIVRSGNAKAMLPCFVGNSDPALKRVGENQLSLPLWLLSHRQDENLAYIADVRRQISNWCGKVLA